jgi:uncharacterized protein YjdB
MQRVAVSRFGGAGSASSVSWRSDDPTIVAVAADGTLLGSAAGATLVWATQGGDSVPLSVTVNQAGRADLSAPGRDASATGTARTTAASVATVVKWLALDAGTARMSTGKTFQFVARAVDANGATVTPAPAFLWTSSNSKVVSVDATGLVRAAQLGQATITVRQLNDTLGAQTSMAVTVVDAVTGNTAALKVTPASATVAVGATMQIVTTPVTANGTPIAGRVVRYTSYNPSVASVSGTGLLRGTGNGTSLVVVACDGLTQAVTVTVGTAANGAPAPTGPTVATIKITPTTVALQVGNSQLLTALALAADGTVVPGATLTWASDAPSVASVAAVGADARVTASAAGTANVMVRSGLVSAQVPVTVTTIPPPPVLPPAGNGQVPLFVQRFDGQSGSVMVSNGVPLTKGLVTTANLSQVHVLVNGVEQRVFVRPLAGHFADGSLRAILVQFDYPIPSAAAIVGTLVVGGGPRTLPDLAPRPTQQLPAAAALPGDPNYLVATRWGGTLYPTKAAAPIAIATQFEADFARLEAADWKMCGPKFDCGRTAGYDRVYDLYQTWLRTGNTIYWYHATAVGADYLKNFVQPNPSIVPWWSQTEGVAVHYWATGDEMSRYQLRKIAEQLAWQTRNGQSYYIGGNYGDDRMRARALTSAIDAAMLEISTQPADAPSYYSTSGASHAYYAVYLTASTLSNDVTAILGSQRTNGQFGGRFYSANVWNPAVGGQSNYMVGLLMTSLIRYYEEVNPDPRIPVALKKCLDDLWANEWDAKTFAFQYHSLRGTDEGAMTPAKPNPQPGLNGFLALPFAWYARVSGDLTYQAKVDIIVTGLASPVSRNWWQNSGKAFDEAFYRLANTFAWRAGLN